MLTSKKKAIFYEFVVDLLVKGIIGYKFPDNRIKKGILKKIFGSYIVQHGVQMLFQLNQLNSLLIACKIIDPVAESQSDDKTIYKFCCDRLCELIKKFSQVGKFYCLKGLLETESSEVFLHYCGTYSKRFPRDSRFAHLCVICEVSFKWVRDYEEHMSFHVSNASPRNAELISQSFKLSVVEITKKNMILDIANDLNMFQTIDRIELISPSFVNVEICKDSCPIQLDRGERVVLQVSKSLLQDIFEVMSVWKIVFKFIRDDIGKGIEVYDLVRYERTESVKKTISELKATSRDLKLYRSLQHHPTCEMEALFKRNFRLPEKSGLLEFMLHEKLTEFSFSDKATRLNQGNYVESMSHSLQIEELTVGREVEKYGKANQRLKLLSQLNPRHNQSLYKLAVENVSDMRPSILPHDTVCLMLQRDYDAIKITPYGDNLRRIYGTIIKIESDCVLLRIKAKINTEDTFHVSFQPNRNNFRVEAHALYLLMNSPKLQSILFPTEMPKLKTTPVEKELNWFNKCVSRNAEQRSAVLHITAGSSYPFPYIIFGPPGTGKTMTLVETVCQLWKQQPNSHILITAQSNSACDELCLRLLRYLPNCDVLRLFSRVKEKELEKMEAELLKVANALENKIFYPSLKKIYQFRIVICTISMAGKLVQARISTQHFTHVVIDESSCCTESQAIVPIIGIVANEHSINGQIILAGDHKQLGPVLTSALAKDRGFQISMMERLINSAAYQKDANTGEYNPNLVTKLLQNFRSCPPILDVCNIMFYDNELVANAKYNWALDWKYLPNGAIPIAMDAIFGSCTSERDSPSLFNMDEVDAVITIVEEILVNGVNGRKIAQSEVGIIAPYRKQVTKIREVCLERHWDEIDVAAVELFQGREKEVIIISTVRSKSRSVGFLGDPKRLNVALTRAKALNIVVGNPKTLRQDKHWRTVIDLYENYGLITTLSENISFARDFDRILHVMTNEFKRLKL
ncbi:putative helicase MOV-10 [Phlebotomus argentipes]|uniref:putative helicase MOV-10 n=1 Tax=Phlebotomus argentipes TaxID=94469 RepID=UPI00289304F4|nr:putative helicase MOV-10 [Phlebotomus argentipes]